MDGHWTNMTEIRNLGHNISCILTYTCQSLRWTLQPAARTSHRKQYRAYNIFCCASAEQCPGRSVLYILRLSLNFNGREGRKDGREDGRGKGRKGKEMGEPCSL